MFDCSEEDDDNNEDTGDYTERQYGDHQILTPPPPDGPLRDEVLLLVAEVDVDTLLQAAPLTAPDTQIVQLLGLDFHRKLLRKWKEILTSNVSDFPPVQLPLKKSSDSNSLEQNDWGSSMEEDLKGRFSWVEYVISYLEDFTFLLMNLEMEELISLKLDLLLVEISVMREVSWDGDKAGVELSLFIEQSLSNISSLSRNDSRKGSGQKLFNEFPDDFEVFIKFCVQDERGESFLREGSEVWRRSLKTFHFFVFKIVRCQHFSARSDVSQDTGHISISDDPCHGSLS